jgi:hypothetical protein
MTVVKLTADSAGLTTAVTAYTDGDVLGELLTIALPVENGARFKIVGANLLDDGDVLDDVDLFLFNASVTPAANNAAHALSDADAAACVAVVRWATADVYDHTNCKQMFKSDIDIYADTTDGNLYGVLVTRSGNAVFTAVDDLHLALYVELNT